MRRIAIYPSVLSADFRCLTEQIRAVEEAGADGIHLDVMDGHFVPNITFGPVVIQWIRKLTRLPCWAHLMITNPEMFIPAFHKIGIDGIMVHPEAKHGLSALADQIHGMGMQAGIAVNPETDAAVIAPYLDQFERVLVMTVHPGFGGQTFMDDQVEKIRQIRQMSAFRSKFLDIDVDGGIDPDTAPLVVEAGANGLVAGSAIFAQVDPAAAVKTLQAAAERGMHA